MYMQALRHLELAVELHSSAELRADALHLKGGVLKDMGGLAEAEEVRVCGRVCGYMCGT